jgi:Mlc titration factor MtfA (ptsG expression regulator)
VSLFRRKRRHTVPDERIAQTVPRWTPSWAALTPDERDLLVQYAGALANGFRWEAARGFRLTDEVRVAIGAQAALLLLGLEDGLDNYHQVTSVIVHATTIVRTGEHAWGDGLVAEGDDPLIGEAIHRGPVVLAWDAVVQQALQPQRGENVVLHEFAHRLDMLDGLSDGTPHLPDAAALERWVAACKGSLQRLRAHTAPSVLRAYAETNPAEFFAVATEVFFTRPVALRDEDPTLYGVLRDYFRQDPAARPQFA